MASSSLAEAITTSKLPRGASGTAAATARVWLHVCACMAYEACRMTHSDQVSPFSTFYSPCSAAPSSLEWPLPFSLLEFPPISPLTVTVQKRQRFSTTLQQLYFRVLCPIHQCQYLAGFLALASSPLDIWLPRYCTACAMRCARVTDWIT